MRGLLCSALCCMAAFAALAQTAQAQSQITNVKDLKAAVYTEMQFSQGGGDACVRLLNASGIIGCSTPGRQRVEGRLQRLEALLPSPDDYPGESRLWWVFGGERLAAAGETLDAPRSRQCRIASTRMQMPHHTHAHPCPRFPITGGTTFLLPPALLAGFLQQCAASPALASRVVGVLVEPQPQPDYSQAAQAPLAELALYADRGYAWNPTGAPG